MLAKLATNEHLLDVKLQLAKLLSEEVEEESLFGGVIEESTPVEWDLGATLTPYMEKREDILFQEMGLKATRRIPGLSQYLDATMQFTGWDNTPESKAFFKTPSKDRIEFSLFWHQLVGVHFITSQLVQRRAALILDEVGVGKTAQAIASICMRAWLHTQFETQKRFPGIFSECDMFAGGIATHSNPAPRLSHAHPLINRFSEQGRY